MSDKELEKKFKKFVNKNRFGISLEFYQCKKGKLEIVVDGAHNITIICPSKGNKFVIDTEEADLDDFIDDCAKYIKAHPRKLEDVLQHTKEVWRKYVEEDDDDDEEDSEDDDDSEDELSSIEITKPISKEDQVDRKQFIYPSIATATATQRLIADYVLMRDSSFDELGFKAAPKNKNLYVWEVKMVPPDETDLNKDFQKLKRKGKVEFIELEVMFPSTWPNEPPFVRVIGPRFKFRTGHVTVGGSICMDLLTLSGWKPIYTLDQVLLQIRTEMGHGGGRLDIGNNRAYNIHEAKSAFVRVANHHKWKVPNQNNLPWNK